MDIEMEAEPTEEAPAEWAEEEAAPAEGGEEEEDDRETSDCCSPPRSTRVTHLLKIKTKSVYQWKKFN